MSEKKICPNCGQEKPEIIHLGADFKSRLASDLSIGTAPSAVCPDCYSKLSAQLAHDAQKKSRRAAKEQNRLNLWRSRVSLIREARDRFAMKDFAGAVVAYEKYFRVLEIIYEVKSNEIEVTHFNNSARSKELVVIASAYWDLMRIYDQSRKFVKRLDQCAEKLGQFLPFTPIYGEISRKIEDYKRVAKNKDAFDKVLKLANKKKRRCFIATASFQSVDAQPVQILSLYRDEILDRSRMGRALIFSYYVVSPPLAGVIERHPFLQKVSRTALTQIAKQIDRKYRLKHLIQS